MKTLTINKEQLQTAFHMLVVSMNEDARLVRAAAEAAGGPGVVDDAHATPMPGANGPGAGVKVSNERVAEVGARRLWQLLNVMVPDAGHSPQAD